MIEQYSSRNKEKITESPKYQNLLWSRQDFLVLETQVTSPEKLSKNQIIHNLKNEHIPELWNKTFLEYAMENNYLYHVYKDQWEKGTIWRADSNNGHRSYDPDEKLLNQRTAWLSLNEKLELFGEPHLQNSWTINRLIKETKQEQEDNQKDINTLKSEILTLLNTFPKNKYKFIETAQACFNTSDFVKLQDLIFLELPTDEQKIFVSLCKKQNWSRDGQLWWWTLKYLKKILHRYEIKYANEQHVHQEDVFMIKLYTKQDGENILKDKEKIKKLQKDLGISRVDGDFWPESRKLLKNALEKQYQKIINQLTQKHPDLDNCSFLEYAINHEYIYKTNENGEIWRAVDNTILLNYDTDEEIINDLASNLSNEEKILLFWNDNFKWLINEKIEQWCYLKDYEKGIENSEDFDILNSEYTFRDWFLDKIKDSYRSIPMVWTNHRTEKSGSYQKYPFTTNKKKWVVLHYTATPKESENNNSVINGFTNWGWTSAHVVIDRNGTRHPCEDPSMITFHAGESVRNGFQECNNFMIWVEFNNNTNIPKNSEEPLTEDQINSFIAYIWPILFENQISLENITTHEKIRDNYRDAYKKNPDQFGYQASKKDDLTSNQYQHIFNALLTQVYRKKTPEEKANDQKRLAQKRKK